MNNSISPAQPVLWSQGQALAFEQLREFANLFFFSSWKPNGLDPRISPLCIGPTGVGKSKLVRMLCDDLDAPLLRLSLGDWLVIGSRGEMPTLLRIYQFVRDNDLGILQLDELCKWESRTQSEYSQFARAELFDVLDKTIAQPAKDMDWTPELSQKYRENFMIVGSGTWQSLWDEGIGRPGIGFTAKGASLDLVTEIRQRIKSSGNIGNELLRRFNSRHIIICPPTVHDFRRASEMFGLTAMAQALDQKLDFEEAAASGYGARWLEETYTTLLLRALKVGHPDILQIRNPYPLESEREYDDDSLEPGVL